jgi:hypothetical protein
MPSRHDPRGRGRGALYDMALAGDVFNEADGLAAIPAVIIAGWPWIVRGLVAVGIMASVRGVATGFQQGTISTAKASQDISSVLSEAIKAREAGKISQQEFETILAAVRGSFPSAIVPNISGESFMTKYGATIIVGLIVAVGSSVLLNRGGR